MAWTKEQQEAIDLRGKNILVSAAAGSGKTAVLVERIKGLILNDRVGIDEMLIVTFSNAAASEMRERIAAAVSDAMERDGGDSFLREQMNNLQKANISTFHSFAMEVIRRYFHLLNVEPDFKICDEAQGTILKAAAMEDLFEQKFEEKNESFLEFLHLYAGSRNEDAVKEMILQTHTFLQSLPEPFSWMEKETEKLSMSLEAFLASSMFDQVKEDIEDSLERALQYTADAAELISSEEISSLEAKWQADIDMLSGLQDSFLLVLQDISADAEGAEAFDRWISALPGAGFQTFRAGKGDKEAYELIKDRVKALRDKSKEQVKNIVKHYGIKPAAQYVDEINATYLPAVTLKNLVMEFHELYYSQKKKKGLLDFNDIEHLALEALAHEDAAEEYRQKFKYIFVDEYQDSNLVQEQLISCITRVDNLFMVGDVKQSIYKFRLAEPEIFLNKYELYKKGMDPLSVKLDLNKNFRSKAPVIRAVNDVFHRVMNKRSAGMEYDDAAALHQGVEYEGEFNWPVEIHLVDDCQVEEEDVDEEIKDMKKAEMEALTASKLISEAKGQLVYDAKKDCERPLSYRDVVILFRSTKGLGDVYYQTLIQEGIPVFLDSGDGYFDTVEIAVFLNLLKVIDNGKQDIPLLSVLRSPIGGFTVDELARIRLEHRKGPYYAAFDQYAAAGEDEELRDKCVRIGEKLAVWQSRCRYMPLETLLYELIDETGYGRYVGALPGGLQRRANLRALVDKAAAFQNSQMKGLFGFIQYIEAIKKGKVSMPQVKLLGEKDDVVRIMTVHKSKGLEFPMVILGGLGKGFGKSRSTSKVVFHKDIGIGMRLVDKENSCYTKTLGQTLIEQRKRREEMAEEIRILYVAFTRAKDRMVLLGTVTGSEGVLEEALSRNPGDNSDVKCYLDFLLPVFKERGDRIRIHDRKVMWAVKKETSDQKEQLREQLRRGFFSEEAASSDPVKMPRQEIRIAVRRQLDFQYPFLRASETKSKYSVSQIAGVIYGEQSFQEYRQQMETAGRKGVAIDEEELVRSRYLGEKYAVPAFAQEGGGKKFSPAERGTILHRVMESIPFETDFADPDMIEEHVGKLVRMNLLTKEEAQVVSIKKILGFFQSEVGMRACRSPQVFKEASFNMIKEVDGEELIIQGTIDCYFKDEKGWVLLDYKSNYVIDEEESIAAIKERYTPQLMLYKEALERIRQITVDEAVLYLFALGKGVCVV